MRVRSPKDFWAGLIFVAIGGGFVLLAQEYRLGDMHRMGPALFPSLVGALLAALGAFIALRAFALDGCRGSRHVRSSCRFWPSCCSRSRCNGSGLSPPSRCSCSSAPTPRATCGCWTFSHLQRG
ncbi:MAG: tripartite tricarboxylate transporter TctB family protein [Alphaproteobacteria bacterium]|nr:MAG: tripartite tricarboxylate transporter TctB family protein [Alphaproteobacteria bacterium]